MATFNDLTPLTYLGRWEDRLLAVGWLGAGHEYTTGTVSEAFFAALVRLLADPWQPVVATGRAVCGFCRFSGGPSQLSYAGSMVPLGVANLYVAGDDKVLVAPSLVAHYIDAHEYKPPTVFQEAVLASAPMKSISYLRDMKARGLPIAK
jgi:hypothetical protein